MENITKVINDNSDSIEIGSIAKGGKIKAYGDFTKMDEFMKRIDAAFVLREYAQNKIEHANA